MGENNKEKYFYSLYKFDYKKEMKEFETKWSDELEELARIIIESSDLRITKDGKTYYTKERGRKKVRGYSLKSNGGHDSWYIYIWDDFDTTSYDKRKEGHKNYSSVRNWTSLGKYDDPKAKELLKNHLERKYGISEGYFDVIYEELLIEVKEKEKTRQTKFNNIMKKLIKIKKMHALDEIPDLSGDLVKLRKLYKEYLVESILDINEHFKLKDLGKNPTIERLEAIRMAHIEHLKQKAAKD